MNGKSKFDKISSEINNQSAIADDKVKLHYQDRAFNDAFKHWRKEKKDSLGFYYIDNPNEFTYQDGVGFIKDYPEAAETASLRHVFNLIGIAMFFMSVVDIVYYYIIPVLFNKLGMDISMDFFAGKLYGNQWIIITIMLVWGIVRRIGPFVVGYNKLDMPLNVMFPTKITNKQLFKYAFPIMLLVCGASTVLTAIYQIIMDNISFGVGYEMMLPKETLPLIFAIIAQVIIIPSLSELVCRGVFLQLLRQFGDGSAIIFTSLIAAAATYSLMDFCMMFIASIIIGYFTIRTGSVITAIIMRVTLQAYAFALYYMYENLDDVNRPVFLIFFIAICFLVGIIFTVRFMLKHSDKLGMTIKNRYLTFGQKSMIAVTCIPVLLWITATFILTLLKTQFKFSIF